MSGNPHHRRPAAGRREGVRQNAFPGRVNRVRGRPARSVPPAGPVAGCKGGSCGPCGGRWRTTASFYTAVRFGRIRGGPRGRVGRPAGRKLPPGGAFFVLLKSVSPPPAIAGFTTKPLFAAHPMESPLFKAAITSYFCLTDARCTRSFWLVFQVPGVTHPFSSFSIRP